MTKIVMLKIATLNATPNNSDLSGILSSILSGIGLSDILSGIDLSDILSGGLSCQDQA